MADHHGAAGEARGARPRARAACRRRGRWSARRAAAGCRRCAAAWPGGGGCARRPRGRRPLLLVGAAEVEPGDVGARVDLALADHEPVGAAGDLLPDGLRARRGARGSGRRRRAARSRRCAARRASGCSSPAIMRNSVVLPAPFGPITPTMPPGGSLKERSSISSRSPKPLLRPSRLDDHVAEPRPGRDVDLDRSTRDALPPRRAAARRRRGAPCSWPGGRAATCAPTRARARGCAGGPTRCFSSMREARLLLLEPAASSCPRTGCRGRGRARGSSRPRCRGSSDRG